MSQGGETTSSPAKKDGPVSGLWTETVKLQTQIETNFKTTSDLLARANALRSRIVAQRTENRKALAQLNENNPVATASNTSTDGSSAVNTSANGGGGGGQQQLSMDQLELQEVLSLYEDGLKVIMASHKEQIEQLAARQESEISLLHEQIESLKKQNSDLFADRRELMEENDALNSQMAQMIAVMERAAVAEEENEREAISKLEALEADNDRLRALLNIGNSYGASGEDGDSGDGSEGDGTQPDES